MNDSRRRDKIEVVHLVAVRAQNNQVSDGVVAAIAVDVSYLQHVANAIAAIGTDSRIVIERELAIIDSLRRRAALLVGRFYLRRVHCQAWQVRPNEN